MAIAEWAAVNIDCADGKVLAEFYAALTGMKLTDHGGGFYALGSEDSVMFFFQPVENYQAPQWPGQDVPQQMHLDFRVKDLDAAVAEAEQLGATLASEQPGTFWKVMLDPAGHPFCLAQMDSAQS